MFGIWRILCAFAVALLAYAVQAESPKIDQHYFPNVPAKLHYFEDSSEVLWHDAAEGNVYRSSDEGKTWSKVRGPREGMANLVIPHPYDPRQAFIMSDDLEHWRTMNRGKTWQSFRTPLPPSTRASLPLHFHADKKHHDWILFTGKSCDKGLLTTTCHDSAYYTKDAFASDVQMIMDRVLQCQWAKMTKELQVSDAAMQRIFCIAWDESISKATALPRAMTQGSGLDKTRMFVSDDLFKTQRAVSFSDMPQPRGFASIGQSRHFLITAVRDSTPGYGGELRLYISRDAEHWTHARFPHGQLTHENAYTVLDGPKYHLVVDVLDSDAHTGALFMSDSTGANFSLSLTGTQRNKDYLVDYEHLANIEGVAIVNVQPDGPSGRVQTRITHDEGASWSRLAAPSKDVEGHKIPCNVNQPESCALHLHALLHLRNLGRVFSSTAPGLVMGVGSVGDKLKPYDECDTYLSTDAGVTWRMVARHPHKHVFGDQGGLIVMVEDAPLVDVLKYSFDYGATWATQSLPAPVEPVALTTAPDGTALKVLLVGSQKRGTTDPSKRHMTVFVDFAKLSKRTCKESDFEKFYPSTMAGHQCLFGHKQWYKRRKAAADCFVRNKFHEPQGKEEPCPCTPADYECDIGFVREQGKCIPGRPMDAPPGACAKGEKTFMGSSGYRRIPGNTCEAGQDVALDAPVPRPCSEAKPSLGAVAHARFEFPAPVQEVLHFRSSPRILVRLKDGQVYQSADDGSTWHALSLVAGTGDTDTALALIANPYARLSAYIVTAGRTVHFTTDGGASWDWFVAPLEVNVFGLNPLSFHPKQPTWLLWTGSRDCQEHGECRVEVWSITEPKQGRWKRVDTYVRKCTFLATEHFPGPEDTIVCESYPTKSGSQRTMASLPVDLVVGDQFYTKKTTVMRNILGYSVFEQYMLVAEIEGGASSLQMHVSLDGHRFSPVTLPPSLQLDHRAYTVLDSVTRAVFMHVTTTSNPNAQWGDIVKSNSNGTYYALSLEHVNRNGAGYVDFEKMQGLDGIALANIVANIDDASVSGTKRLQTKITHNDGGHWTTVVPPEQDSHGVRYACDSVGCNLHLHNILERPDLRMTLTSPSALGFMLATGNVGRELLPYNECDTFLTRDGGFTWEEVHKSTHKWEYGDHGSIIVMVDDQHATDSLLYTLDQGLTWETYRFGVKMRVWTIDTVPEDTKRKFVLLGDAMGKATAVFLDFSSVLPTQCVYDPKNEAKNDFEKWSPSQQREEACLFGSQTWFWRRKRDRVCYIGSTLPDNVVEKVSCECTDADFECEFNHYRDAQTGQCVLYPGAQKLLEDEAAQCSPDAPEYDGYWYERTNVRKIPLSQCSGGHRPDRGRRHRCSHTPQSHGLLWWLFVLAAAGALGYFAATWLARHNNGALFLGGAAENSPLYRDIREQVRLGVQFVGGLASLVWSHVVAFASDLPILRDYLRRSDRPFSSYHMLSTDEDAEILRDYDSDLEA